MFVELAFGFSLILLVLLVAAVIHKGRRGLEVDAGPGYAIFKSDDGTMGIRLKDTEEDMKEIEKTGIDNRSFYEDTSGKIHHGTVKDDLGLYNEMNTVREINEKGYKGKKGPKAVAAYFTDEKNEHVRIHMLGVIKAERKRFEKSE